MNQAATKNVIVAAEDARLRYLTRHGRSSLAYSSLQPGMQCFLEPGVGYIAYVSPDSKHPVSICLSDPICKSDDYEQLLTKFVNQRETPVFVHISKAIATILSTKGFLINEIGSEMVIDLEQFSLSGSDKAFLRSQRNRAQKDGLIVLEQSMEQVGADALRQLSDRWMEKKVVSSAELSFLLRPIVYDDEKDVRKFYAYRNEKLVGFGAFDPMYEDGQVIGYIANTLRSTSDGNYSVPDTIILKAMEVFKAEGKKFVSLGFLPLYAVSDSGEFAYSPLLKKAFQFAYEHLNWVYEFKDLAFHKTRYRPGTNGCDLVKVYCAYQEPVELNKVMQVFQATGINFGEQLKKQLKALVQSGMARR
jgi:lysylphosphatidylglycerol synthetase-like protein (DUF2156 family)